MSEAVSDGYTHSEAELLKIIVSKILSYEVFDLSALHQIN